jgi:23S rRNA pseudouridine2605 synthase
VRYSVGARRSEQSYLAYYKPPERKITGSRRPAAARRPARSTRGDLPRPRRGRWIALGPLDPGTSGLEVLTTDGTLAHRLALPESAVEREYAVRALGEPSTEQLERLLGGVELDEGPTRIASITPAGGTGSNVWYHVVFRQSRQRGLRALFDAVGIPVSRVIRVRYGPITLGDLRRGQHRALTPAEIEGLYKAAGQRLN